MVCQTDILVADRQAETAQRGLQAAPHAGPPPGVVRCEVTALLLRITALLRREGWRVNHKRVERIWRQEGLKVPKKQPRKGRLWLNDGSCLRLRPCWQDHVWAYDFVADRTRDGRPLKMLTVYDNIPATVFLCQ